MASEMQEFSCSLTKGGPMNQVRDQIMEVIIRSPGSSLEEVMLECRGLTWNQVFIELDRMSRTGQVRLDEKRPGLYTVTSTTDSQRTLDM
jgi:hypothetical protein